MDDLGKMLGGLSGGQGGAGGTGDIAGAIGGLVGGSGGLGGLVGQLQQAGLGDAVSSWVGTGPNQAVDPATLGAALGPEKVQAVAEQSGIDVGALLPMLAGALPTIVDALTPDGQVPSGDAAAGLDIGGILQGLGGAANAGPDSPLGQLGKMLGGR
jgi:uncharacterized protein YidB (DUF937 family)